MLYVHLCCFIEPDIIAPFSVVDFLQYFETTLDCIAIDASQYLASSLVACTLAIATNVPLC